MTAPRYDYLRTNFYRCLTKLRLYNKAASQTILNLAEPFTFTFVFVRSVTIAEKFKKSVVYRLFKEALGVYAIKKTSVRSS